MIALAMPRKAFGTRAAARTAEIERCLAMNPEWILMMDSDQTMPLTALRELGERLESDGLPLIYVIDCPSHNSDDSNVIYHPDGSLAAFTISCCLIHHSVFTILKKPWFSSEYAYIEEKRENGKIIWRVDKKFTDDNEGEDIYFSRHCLEANIRIEVLDDLVCDHHDLGEL